MDSVKIGLKKNVRILKSSVNKQAVYGLLISLVAIIVATLVNCYTTFGTVSLDTIYSVQKTQPALWLLDSLPFVFLFWGQYVGSILAYEASAMIIDQTGELRSQAASLEQRVMYEATHDNLTELPNRVLLHDRLEQAINASLRQQNNIGLIILDLDRFKEVNDTLGHFAGDRLLKQVAIRLNGVVRDSDTLARMGGDEFAILLTQMTNDQALKAFLKRVTKVMLLPFNLEGISLEVQASMGVAICPEHGKDVDTLIQRAEVAMYAAKQQKKGHAIYSPKLDHYSPHRLTLMGELRQALKEEELILHYQPKIELENEKFNRAEALIRWKHPQHGLLNPEDFIGLAERTGLIKDVTKWVLKESIKQILLWQEKGLSISLSVNISPACLLSSELPEIITGLLGSNDLGDSVLTIEITETTIIQDPDLAYEILTRLKALGADIAIDDFGTGYSSLAHLKKLPVNEMKIDKSFVMDMLENKDDEIIVKSIIDLAHNLGLIVVAEGVETEEVALRLSNMNCDMLQGYFFSRPLPADQFEEWFTSNPAINFKQLSASRSGIN
ncbi:MAG: EAL domain-containing protein [Thermodesulfobacteriota bacterium]